jgi:hypothetical protein
MIDADPIEELSAETFDLLKVDPGERLYWIRHDVDDRIDMAWTMAQAEHERGIKSIYFFLHTAPYFRWQAFLDMARDFVKAGHTIGLHNNAVTSAFRGGDFRLAENILKRDLGYLRQAGDVWITSSHGDAWNNHHNILNYEMFEECRRNGRGSVMTRLPLAHFGLGHEAYFTPSDYYLSDSGSKWSSNPIETINKFNKLESGILQLLIHPQWWQTKTA